MASIHWVRGSALTLVLCLIWAGDSAAFLANGRWIFTATDGATAPNGNPITLTWSIVPDGTNISHLSTPSNLFSTFDALFPNSEGLPLEDRLWFQLVKQCFDRWSAVSGLTFVYEPADDGLSNHAHGSWAGALDMRGDVRLGGAMIPATPPNNPLAETGLIPNADITIDTTDTSYFGNAGGAFAYINLRTTLMHEIGHSLGLGHSNSNNAAFLMENFSQTSFDGPQLDDIRGVQYLYGDANEKADDGGGNESIATARPLGTIAAGQTITIGKQAATGTFVLSSETDFVSIANANDDDYFSFSIAAPSLVDVILTPVGATYHERGTINTSALSDLNLELYAMVDGVPALLASANANAIGLGESLLDQVLNPGGAFYVKVTGSADALQLYQLAVTVDESLQLGDFNADGTVDAADYAVWRDTVGADDDSALHHRGDGLPGVDGGDYAIWKLHFGESAETLGTAAVQVSEPTTTIGFAFIGLALLGARPRSSGG